MFEIFSPRNRMFWTPLACAVDGGHSEVVKLLLEMTAEVGPKDRHNVSNKKSILDHK